MIVIKGDEGDTEGIAECINLLGLTFLLVVCLLLRVVVNGIHLRERG